MVSAHCTLLARQALWVRIQTSLKIINRRHKQRVANTLYRKMFDILIRFSFPPIRRTNLLVGISFPVYISISTSRNGTQDDTLFVSGNKLLVNCVVVSHATVKEKY
jgi:hypothetical protein